MRSPQRKLWVSNFNNRNEPQRGGIKADGRAASLCRLLRGLFSRIVLGPTACAVGYEYFACCAGSAADSLIRRLSLLRCGFFARMQEKEKRKEDRKYEVNHTRYDQRPWQSLRRERYRVERNDEYRGLAEDSHPQNVAVPFRIARHPPVAETERESQRQKQRPVYGIGMRRVQPIPHGIVPKKEHHRDNAVPD